MADEPKGVGDSEGSPGPAVQDPPATATKTGPAKKPNPSKTSPKPLPRYKLLLHNDDVNTVERVIGVIVRLTPLETKQAVQKTLEAHEAGIALLLVTHRERAELYQQQFTSAKITTTIEPE